MLFALIAIALWSSMAVMVARLSHVGPFYLTGIGLLLGGLFMSPRWCSWRVPVKTFITGAAALFFYHAALFTAFKLAPVVSANLVNYLWPLLIVVLAPLFDHTQKLHRTTIAAALLGFAGAYLSMTGGSTLGFETAAFFGYLLALMAALIWSCYTLQLRRLPAFPSAAVGGFNLFAAMLSLLTATQIETLPTLTFNDAFLLCLIGLGPLGFAFYCWDQAAKQLASNTLGVLSFITPVLSTALLLFFSEQALTPSLMIAALMVLSATAMVLIKPKTVAS